MEGLHRLRSDHVEYLSDGTLVEPGELVDVAKHDGDERMEELIATGLLLPLPSEPKSTSKTKDGD